MLDLSDFEKMREEMKGFEKDRENLIISAREVIQLSKLIIHAIQRGDVKKAGELAVEIKEKVKQLPKESYDTDMRSVALQEYVEALTLLSFVDNGKILNRQELGVDANSYLLGLCDLAGELVRLAVDDVINKDYDSALKIKSVVEDIYGEFLKFDLRNGLLRKKSDSLKWNLKKLEDLALSISTRRVE
ncbi:MAG: hypothetical protein V1914_04850 [archaeon]